MGQREGRDRKRESDTDVETDFAGAATHRQQVRGETRGTEGRGQEDSETEG